MRSLLSGFFTLIVLVGFVMGTTLIVLAEDDPKEELHQCTHPGQDTCPGEQVSKDLHCVACDTSCGGAHDAGCICKMDYPCGNEYREDEYCTPVPQY